MTVGKFFGKTGRGLAAAAILAIIGLTALPRPADAGGGWGGGGISPGAAVGIGLGAFALGSVLANPYHYNPYYYYPYSYYPLAPAYYSPYYPRSAPAYPPPLSYPPQSSYPPQVGRSGGNIARQLNQQELNSLQAAPFNPPPSPYYSPPRY